MQITQKITPFLWFDKQAGDAAAFYTAIFSNSTVTNTRYFPQGSPAPEGSVMSVEFDLAGQSFIALNGGPHFTFSPAISFFVHCENQAEVDHLWSSLGEGGVTEQCGWLRDKFGVSWQIVPRILGEMLSSSDSAAANRTMGAMMQMIKLDIAALEKAYRG